MAWEWMEGRGIMDQDPPPFPGCIRDSYDRVLSQTNTGEEGQEGEESLTASAECALKGAMLQTETD